MQEKEEKITFFNERDKSLNDALKRLMLRGRAAIAATRSRDEEPLDNKDRNSMPDKIGRNGHTIRRT